ncbi:hypothetical protein P3T37_007138 [Kitasatospora sp. MAA4]|uniref:hypothetical protein n=1 Tax=Kitasatospora sp. MAA4 TaxID=3035093 RepID=UPI002475B07F|nr:hypothetical protein [Kitasatospora sp. MAA4]MDH6137705.1 hypothetical protein [Kitasatospora sp. MAA4]
MKPVWRYPLIWLACTTASVGTVLLTLHGVLRAPATQFPVAPPPAPGASAPPQPGEIGSPVSGTATPADPATPAYTPGGS